MLNFLEIVESIDGSINYTCGSGAIEFPGTFPYIVHLIITIIKIAVPILLVIFGMLDLGKAVVAAKEEEIKKGQQTLIKRIIAGVIVFFVVTIVQILINFLSKTNENDGATITNCFKCFVNADCTKR